MAFNPTEIEAEGRVAYLCGRSLIGDNPYRRDQEWEKADAWENGWMEARHTAEEGYAPHGEDDDEPLCSCGGDVWWRCPC